MSFVDTSDGGWTELRVHGVSGTPPASMLEHPNVQLVAGNAQAGFYRRAWDSPRTAEDSPDRRLEAYSWGGLTSGDTKRALWLLLLPFMLLNVAFYMAPYRRAPDSDDGKRTERFSASVQRLFALSFTLTFTLTVVSVSMDLVGWQCGAGPAAGQRQACAGGAGWLSWLGWSWLNSPGRQLAATALVPVAAILVLWRLGSITWHNLESTQVPQVTATGGAPDPRTPLEDRAMWNGRQAVRKLRALHVSAGLAVPGVFLSAALLPDPSRGLAALADRATWDRPWPALRAATLLGLLLLLAGVAVTVARPRIASRRRPAAGTVRAQEAAHQKEEQDERRSPFRILPWVALGLTVLAGVAAVPRPAGGRGSAGSGLPWLVACVLGLFAVQVVLVLVLLGVCGRLRLLAARYSRGERAQSPAWRGFGMPGIAMLGWLLAGGFSAGAIMRAADMLGTPAAEGQRGGPTALVVPTAYHWAAVLGLATGVVAGCLGGYGWWQLRRVSPDDLQLVDRAYFPDKPVPSDAAAVERRREVAGQWRHAQEITPRAQRLFGGFLAAAGALVAAGIVLYLWLGTRLLTGAPLLVTVSGLALAGFVLGVLWVGRQAYRNPAFRRTVGIAWDLGTFWPRAVHPLAPPCYAERAIPDLIGRLQLHAGSAAGPGGPSGGRRALLSCHSQGTVLGAVALLQVEQTVSANTCFLTYGSPLARLYQRFFPAYFSPAALRRIGGFLACEGADPRARASWRWRNLYRPSDPIGGPVFAAYPAVLELRPGHQGDGDHDDVDRQLVDPVFARSPGDPCYPPTRGHSDYFADPAFDWTVDALRTRELPTCGPPSPAQPEAQPRAPEPPTPVPA